MIKNWNLESNFTPQQLSGLSNSLKGFSKNEPLSNAYLILAKLLLQRGITNVDSAKTFNNFGTDQLHDPFLMLNMDKAVTRIQSAIHANEKIMVYGDYDVDGTTSVALMMTFLRELTSNLIYYIPDRYTEGYGISFKGIDTANEEKASLIIALDCGIKAVEKVAYATKLGVDFIICDHHTPGDIIPNAVAVLDPKQPLCKYPYKELSGAAIGFKLCQALATKFPVPKEKTFELLDLTAISLACDIVPLTGENRVLAALGLRQINKQPRPSISALLGEKHPKKQITISDLVFAIGPKINAAGRIASGKKAVDLLLASESHIIEEFTNQINEFNTQRKEHDHQITEEALEMIRGNKEMHVRNSSVLYQPDWHKGVVGIVASRVIEHYYRPTIILTKSSEETLGGSVRSVKGFDVYQALEQCQEHMIQFGGHKYAAGLTLKKDQLPQFIQKFEEVVTSQKQNAPFKPEITIDAEINLSDITFQLKSFIDKLSPFGPQNMAPTFVTKNVIDTGNSRIVGADKKHLKLEITYPNESTIIQGIAFGLGALEEEIKTGRPFDVVYAVDINYWKSSEILQVMVRDIKFSDTQQQ